MNREEIIQKAGRPILRTSGILQGVFLLAFISSPVIWIWGSWYYAWRVGLTSFFGMLIMYGFYKLAKETISESVDEYLKENSTKPKSKFQQRLEQLQKERTKTN